MSRNIIKTSHDNNTTIIVSYENQSLVVGVYRNGGIAPQRIKYYNPIEVTNWFENNSIANTQKWKEAYWASGLTGKDFSRPEGNKDVEIEVNYLAVPYRTQRDNDRYPSGTCNVTSYAMAMLYFGVKTIENSYRQFEDDLEYYMSKNKLSRHTHDDLVKMARAHGLDTRFQTGKTLDDIRENVRKGYVSIVSGKFTESGHIVVIIGLQGKDFIVHDPWGNYNTNYKDFNGKAVIYSEKTLTDVLINKRNNGIWLHTIKGKIEK